MSRISETTRPQIDDTYTYEESRANDNYTVQSLFTEYTKQRRTEWADELMKLITKEPKPQPLTKNRDPWEVVKK